MSKFCLGILLVVNFVFSQNKAPVTFSKIKFEYEQKSNYYVDQDGVYADTLLLAFDYPNLKYTLKTNPVDAKTQVGFVSFITLSKEDKKKLVGTLYHNTQKIIGIHDVKKNTTKLKITRSDIGLKEIFKKYLNENYYSFKYSVSINYNEKSIKIDYPSVKYVQNFDSQLRSILFDNDKKTGIYKFTIDNTTYNNLVLLNENCINKITPGDVFSNNEFGIEKIISLHYTTTLKFYNYE
ncbi:hypothetical protein [Flavobacterium sp.]|uniref:hypothetical protein n=1 Tax=Flavobacterium sp. TaxID=239 RepID=UPI00286A5844|nr:hypothetical protein [Flavobacterium sp.]